MDPNSLSVMQGAAGAGGDKVYVEDVFNTHLYSGDGDGGSTPASRAITTGMDLDENAGMIWIKGRGWDIDHALFDTIRGATNMLRTNSNLTTLVDANSLTAFTSDGFTTSGSSYTNLSSAYGGGDFAAYSFKAVPGFFDVVTWSGNGTPGREITHSLASTPGFIAIKKSDGTAYWTCWHRSTGDARLFLNDSMAAVASAESFFGNDSSYIAPTSTEFTVGSDADVNGLGSTYVAYIFAHDDQQFGDGGDESIIKCGGYSGSGSSGKFIDLGWEPQWVMVKRATGGTGLWLMADNMRGIVNGGDDPYLQANDYLPEVDYAWIDLTPTGFKLTDTGQSSNYADDYVYIAIRRGPMKTPEDATEVFNVVKTSSQPISIGFTTDLAIVTATTNTSANYFVPRLTNLDLDSASAAYEATNGGYFEFDLQNNFSTGTFFTGWETINWMFKRAPGFFDVVCYDGTLSNITVTHNLGVVPEMMIIKSRSNAEHWCVYHKDLTSAGYHLRLNADDAENANSTMWNSTDPTASVFSVGANGQSNILNGTYVAYLFASCPGVSKVGTYTGNGASSTIDIDCGFTAGARFVLIKRTDQPGNWFAWDSVRGIVSGADPYLRLDLPNSQLQEDYIDPLNAGFTISDVNSPLNEVNAPSAEYIYLAIA